MKIVDQVDAQKFNKLAGVLNRLGLISGYATVLSTSGGSWWSNWDDTSVTMFDERWVVVVSDDKIGLYVEYEV